jgi:hypothetical protein
LSKAWRDKDAWVMSDQNNDPSRSPLAGLARTITACGKQGMTPVIVCSDQFILQDDFYLALCDAVRAASGCEVRFDLLPGHRMPGIRSLFSRRHSAQRLNRRLSGNGSASMTIALSRTSQPTSEIIVGFAGPNDELPSYAKPIELAA